MRILTAVVLFAGLCGISDPVRAASAPAVPPKIEIAGKSVRIGGVDVCTEKDGYISLDAVQKVLGPYDDMYAGGLGVQVYSWPPFGIQVQRGWRGPDEDKIFKFQAWLSDHHNTNEDKSTGCFRGKVTVLGVAMSTDSKFKDLRAQLESVGFRISEEPGFIEAENGPIRIFTVHGTDQIERVEVWIQP
jgi:hypothetical protein